MSDLVCKKCGSSSVVYKSVGPHLGAYCKDCGSWIKWVSRKGFYKNFIDRTSVSTKVNSDETNIDNSLLDKVLDDKEPW